MDNCDVIAPAALVQCRNSGLSDQQTQKFVLVCGRLGVEVSAALEAVRSVTVSSDMAFADAATKFFEVAEPKILPERPDLSAILAEQRLSRAERRDDHRRLSMRQPTGMPWDRRR